MKYVFTLLCFSILACFGQADSIISDQTLLRLQRSIPIEDIIETLSECNCMVLGMRGELTEKEKRMVTHGQALIFGRTFHELDSLYQHGNDLMQLYAFGGICNAHPDSITDEHLKILEKEVMVNIYRQDGGKMPKESISNIAKQMHHSIVVRKKQQEVQLKVEELIESFIMRYSEHPKTYVSKEFYGYHVYSVHNGMTLEKEKGSEVYSIGHRFNIKNKAGETGEFTAWFKVDSDFTIVLIEPEKSGTVSVYPPQLKWWLDTYGRELSLKDRADLKLNK